MHWTEDAELIVLGYRVLWGLETVDLVGTPNSHLDTGRRKQPPSFCQLPANFSVLNVLIFELG